MLVGEYRRGRTNVCFCHKDKETIHASLERKLGSPVVKEMVVHNQETRQNDVAISQHGEVPYVSLQPREQKQHWKGLVLIAALDAKRNKRSATSEG